MKTNILFALTLLLNSILVNAQAPLSNLLKQAANFPSRYQGIEYKVAGKQTNPFRQTDTIYVNWSESVQYNRKGKIIAQNSIEKADAFNHQSYTQRFRNKDCFYIINLTNNSYTVKYEQQEEFSALYFFREDINAALSSDKKKIFMQADSLINNTLCYAICIELYTPNKKKATPFKRLRLYLDKKTLLPVFTQKYLSGFVRKSRKEIVQVHYYNEGRFYDYKTDNTLELNPPDISQYKLDKAETLKSDISR